ncbi:hypothetical protein ACFQRB_18345 [Halobaculum litoreum]|uniref:Uncharacterized protein n=1 Tax=Halobaculum litoreum TaxID=3031998 RepID=A0ABD5XS23_9EURY
MPTEHSPDLLVRALFIAPAERATARLRRLLSEPTRRRVAVEAVADVDEAAAALAAGVADCAVCLHDPLLVDGTDAVAELAAATGSKPVFAAAPLSEAGAALDAGATEVLPIDDGTIVHDVSVARLERCVADAQAAAASSPDPDILSALSARPRTTRSSSTTTGGTSRCSPVAGATSGCSPTRNWSARR